MSVLKESPSKIVCPRCKSYKVKDTKEVVNLVGKAWDSKSGKGIMTWFYCADCKMHWGSLKK